MAFSVDELASIANAALDYYFDKGKAYKQSVQEKPLVSKMEAKAKTFPGGKENISIGIKGNYGDGSGNDTLKGYTHDDTVTFYTPANIDRANYPWRETHIGLTMTHTELKIDGLSVSDTNGGGTQKHSRRDMHVLVGLLEDKIEDLGESYLRGLNNMLWGDGVADALGFAGVQSIVTEDPTTGLVGGIDRAVEVWWRNRAATEAHALSGGQGPITSDPTNGGALAQFLQGEWRQLRRYGSTPDFFVGGADFCDALETEYRANGYYTDSGFTGGADLAVGTIKFKGLDLVYDGWLDDNGFSKRGYMLDCKRIFLEKMASEWRRMHTPARPADQFVLFRSVTSTGQMVASQCNSSLVVDIV